MDERQKLIELLNQLDSELAGLEAELPALRERVRTIEKFCQAGRQLSQTLHIGLGLAG